MSTNKHLPIVRDEIIAKAATYTGWTTVDATDEMKLAATSSVVDYRHIAAIAVTLLAAEKVDVPNVGGIHLTMSILREEMPWMSDDEILIQATKNAMSDANGIASFEQIVEIDYHEIAHTYRYSIVHELSAIFSICAHRIADAEYAEYQRLRERVTD